MSSDLTPARLEELPPVRLEKLIQMHEKDARTHERNGRLGDAAFHSETADRLTSLAARVIELEAANARLNAHLPLLRYHLKAGIEYVAALNSSAGLDTTITRVGLTLPHRTVSFDLEAARTALETPNAE